MLEIEAATSHNALPAFGGDDAYAARRQCVVKGPRNACIPDASGNQRRKPLARVQRLVPVRQHGIAANIAKLPGLPRKKVD